MSLFNLEKSIADGYRDLETLAIEQQDTLERSIEWHFVRAKKLNDQQSEKTLPLQSYSLDISHTLYGEPCDQEEFQQVHRAVHFALFISRLLIEDEDMGLSLRPVLSESGYPAFRAQIDDLAHGYFHGRNTLRSMLGRYVELQGVPGVDDLKAMRIATGLTFLQVEEYRHNNFQVNAFSDQLSHWEGSFPDLK